MNIVNFGADVQKMTSREIAELTGKRHDHVMTDIRKMLNELGLDAPGFSGTYRTDRGNEYECFNLPKRETMILVSGYSIPMRARIIDRWEDLETGKATPAAVPTNRASEDMAVLSALADALRLEGSARLGVMRKGMEIVAPHLLPALPTYAIDAPNGSSSDIGSEPTASLSALLVEHGCRLTAVAANKRLEALGYLKQMQRSSSRGGIKKYWSITRTGAKYGKNATSDRNQRETQPVWYKATAAAMIQEIKSA
mgnify:CR=1 FL=1